MIWGRADRITREAAEWVVLIDSPRFDASAAARFKIWLNISNDHRPAFQLASRAWTDLDQLDRLKPYPEIVALLTAPAAGGAAGAAQPGKVAPDRRALLIGAGAGVVALSLAGYAVLAPSGAEAYATGIGERRELVLVDGTRVVLNAATRIEARIGGGRRRVRLVAGEALFSIVASDLGPLSITTSSGEIDAASGEILVKQLPEGVRVALLSNGARAARHGLFGNGAPIAAPGQSEIVFGPDLVEIAPRPAEALARRTLWREGRLAFDDTPLSEAVADVSRQTGARFVFADPALRDLRVGGLIDARDLAGFLALLRQNLAVSAERGTDGVIELRSPPEP